MKLHLHFIHKKGTIIDQITWDWDGTITNSMEEKET